MRKILCLVLAICMAIGGVAAMADVRTPARQSQEALQRAFTRHLEAFMNGIDLDREALRLDVSAMDDALVMGTAQRTDGVLDVSLDAEGLSEPARLQIDQEAAYLYVNGQTYKLGFDQLEGILQAVASTIGGVVPQVDPTAYSELGQLLVSDLILPAVSINETPDGMHLLVSLTGDTLSQGLIRFGDHIVANERYLGAINGPMALFQALLVGREITRVGLRGFAEAWPQLRAQLSQLRLPFFLNIDVTVRGSSAQFSVIGQMTSGASAATLTMSGEASAEKVSFSGNVISNAGATASFSGTMEPQSGTCSLHMENGGGMVFNLTSNPIANGWRYQMSVMQGGQMRVNQTLTMTDTGTAFDLNFSQEDATSYRGTERVAVTVHFDKNNAALIAQLSTSDNLGVGANVVGVPMGEGYRLMMTFSENGEVNTTAELTVTNGDESFAIDALAYPGSKLADQKVALDLNFSKSTGAYTLDFVTPDGATLTAEGVLSYGAQTLNASMRQAAGLGSYAVGDGDSWPLEDIWRVEFERLNDRMNYRLHFAVYERYYYDDLTLTTGLDINVDKRTGTFHGGFDVSGNGGLVFEGVLNDNALHLMLMPQYVNDIYGLLEISAAFNGETASGSFTFADDGDVTSGTFLWSDYYKSLTWTGEDGQWTLSLTQDRYGTPTALSATLVDGYYDSYALTLNSDGLTVLADGERITLSGAFQDEYTYVLDLGVSGRYYGTMHYYLTATLEDDGLTLTASQGNETLAQLRLSRTEQAALDRLSDGPIDLELTAETVKMMLEGLKQALPFLMEQYFGGGYAPYDGSLETTPDSYDGEADAELAAEEAAYAAESYAAAEAEVPEDASAETDDKEAVVDMLRPRAGGGQ